MLTELETVKICIIPIDDTKNLTESFRKSVELFSNVISFEIYTREVNNPILIFLNQSTSTAVDSMSRLDEFVVGNDNLAIVFNSSVFKFVKRLSRYRLNLNLATRNRAEYCRLVQTLMSQSTCREVRIGVELNNFIRTNLFEDDIDELGACGVQDKHVCVERQLNKIDELVQVAMDKLTNVCEQKIKCLQACDRKPFFPSLVLGFELKNIDCIRIGELTSLETLDLSTVHVHSGQSICSLIGDLKSKQG